MSSCNLFYHPTNEANRIKKLEQFMFFKPYLVSVIEGGSSLPQHHDVETVAILSSN